MAINPYINHADANTNIDSTIRDQAAAGGISPANVSDASSRTVAMTDAIVRILPAGTAVYTAPDDRAVSGDWFVSLKGVLENLADGDVVILPSVEFKPADGSADIITIVAPNVTVMCHGARINRGDTTPGGNDIIEPTSGALNTRLDSARYDSSSIVQNLIYTTAGWTIEMPNTGIVRWRSEWVPGNDYEVNEMAVDTGWLMVANASTSARPAPQPERAATFALPEDLSGWAASQLSAATLATGIKVTFTKGGIIESIRVWIPFIGATREYRVITVDMTGADPVFDIGQWVIPSATGYITDGINRLIKKDAIAEIYLEVRDTAGSTTFSGDWNYILPNNITDPANGEVMHSNKELGTLRVSKTDSIGGLRGAELLSLGPGDEIEITGTSWSIITVTDDVPGNFVAFDVEPTVQGTAGTGVNFDFIDYSSIALDIISSVDFWLANQVDGLAIKGIYSIDGADAVENDTAYGIDIKYAPMVQSADWDFAAHTG